MLSRFANRTYSGVHRHTSLVLLGKSVGIHSSRWEHGLWTHPFPFKTPCVSRALNRRPPFSEKRLEDDQHTTNKPTTALSNWVTGVRFLGELLLFDEHDSMPINGTGHEQDLQTDKRKVPLAPLL